MIRIGTRGSDLALWQAHYLADQLKENGYESVIKIIKTRGDKIQNLSFDKIEGKGFFTKEIEDELLAHEVDVAIHSMKDLPTAQPGGLVISGVSNRAAVQDILIIKKSAVDSTQALSVKKGGIIGTSSIRRKSFMQHLRKDVNFHDIRGNVPTRVQKLRDGDMDAIILAKAGVDRLNLYLEDLHVHVLNPMEFVPAPAQGVLAYQTRENDIETRKVVQKIHVRDVSTLTNVERTILKLFDGGCHLALGAYCTKDANQFYHCYGMYASSLEEQPKFVRLSQSTTHRLAERVYEALTT